MAKSARQRFPGSWEKWCSVSGLPSDPTRDRTCLGVGRQLRAIPKAGLARDKNRFLSMQKMLRCVAVRAAVADHSDCGSSRGHVGKMYAESFEVLAFAGYASGDIDGI